MSTFRYVINGNPYEVSVDSYQGDEADVTVNGVTYRVQIARETRRPSEIHRPQGVPGSEPQPVRTRPQVGLGDVKAPLPGRVQAVLVKEGDRVEQGQGVCVIEAMKMDNEMWAPAAGVVTKVHVREGQNVLEGDLLIEIGGAR